jgi:hypothetical protein
MPCLGECNVHKSTDFFQNSAGPIASTFLAGTLGLHEILMALAFISGHLWMPTWAIANLTKGHVRRQMVGFLLPLLSFSPVWVVSVLLLASTLNGKPPLLD